MHSFDPSSTIVIVGPILFPLGSIAATPNALASLSEETISNALNRHAQGDWGDADEPDREANEEALLFGFRLFSVYRDATQDPPVPFWIITEADRSVTTVLLPSDY